MYIGGPVLCNRAIIFADGQPRSIKVRRMENNLTITLLISVCISTCVFIIFSPVSRSQTTMCVTCHGEVDNLSHHKRFSHTEKFFRDQCITNQLGSDHKIMNRNCKSPRDTFKILKWCVWCGFFEHEQITCVMCRAENSTEKSQDQPPPFHDLECCCNFTVPPVVQPIARGKRYRSCKLQTEEPRSKYFSHCQVTVESGKSITINNHN